MCVNLRSLTMKNNPYFRKQGHTNYDRFTPIFTNLKREGPSLAAQSYGAGLQICDITNRCYHTLIMICLSRL